MNPEDTANYIQHRYFKYDGLGRLTYEHQVEQVGTFSLYDPLTGHNNWSRKLIYDETINSVSYAGLLTSAYDARNIQTQFRYDNLSRIYQVNYSDSTPTVTNYYDRASTGYFNKGRLTQASTGAVGSLPATSQSYNFDIMGRVANNQQTVSDQSYAMTYSYNLGGALTSETYPSGRVVSYAFDDGARLSQVSSGSKVYANQFDYSSSQGLLKAVTLGNGAVESYDYNSRLQMKSIDLTKSGTQIQHYDYKYGVYNPVNNTVDEAKNTGQIARIEGFISASKQWQQNFAYDSLGRFTSAREFRGDNGQQSWLVNYDYDVFGNRYQKQAQNSGNPFPQIWTEDADITQATNRFASNVSYDDAGNILTDQKFRQLKFQYDANNRQKQSSNLDDTGAVVSVYDAGGQRVATQVGSSLTNVLVYDAGGKLVAEYGSPASTGGTQYLSSDQQGSPRAVTNSSGAVISRHDYLPFGEEIGAVGMRTSGQGYSAGDNTRQKYAGMEADDATGMSHTLWRQYDSSSGRWTSPDPYTASMTIANPQSFNRYSYVGNDPVDMTDPSGLMTKEGQPDPDTADAKDEPPGDPFETGRSITAEAEGRYEAGVKQAIALKAFNDAMEQGDIDGAREIIGANPSIGHEMNSSYNPDAEGSLDKHEIKVADVVLYEGVNENTKIVAHGSVDPLDYSENPARYNLDVEQGGVDSESSIFTIGVTFVKYHMGDWDKDSLRATVSPNGKWKLVETLPGIPPVRKDWGSDKVSVLLNIRARDLKATDSTVHVQVSASYTSLYRTDGKQGTEQVSKTMRATIRLQRGKANSTIREIP